MARNIGTLTLNLIAQTARFTQPLRDAESQSRTTSNNISSDADRMGRSLNQAGSNALNFKTALLGIGAAVGIGSLKSLADEYVNIQNKLILVTNSQDQLKIAMNDTFDIAQRSASEWSAVNDVYSKYMANQKNLNLSQKDAARLTEITTKAVAMSGSTAQASAGALFQFGQALDGNILRAQEYNSLVDGAGGLLNAMAAGLKITRAELRQMMLDGKLTGEVIADSLLAAGDTVEKQYAATATTIEGAFTKIKASATRYIGEEDKGVGVSNALVSSLGLLAENFGTVATAIGVAAWIALTRAMTSQVLATKASITGKLQELAATQAATAAKVTETAVEVNRNRAVVGSLASEQNLIVAKLRGNVATAEKLALETRAIQVAIQLSLANRGLAASEAALAVATNASVAATSRATAARSLLLALTGGWVGLAVGVASVAAGYFLFSKRSEDATKTIDLEKNSVAELSAQYKELSVRQRDNEYRALVKEIDSVSTSFRTASSDLSGFIEALPMSDENIATIRKLNNEFVKINGTLRGNPESYYESVRALNILSDEQLNKLDKSIVAYESSRNAVDKSQGALSALNNVMEKFDASTDGANKKLSEQEKALVSAAEAYDKFTAKYNEDFASKKVENELIKTGKYTKEQIALVSEWAKTYSYNAEQMASQTAKNDLKRRFELFSLESQSNSLLDKQNEKEKERLEIIKAQGNSMKLNAKVLSNASKYGFADLEQKYSLPAGLLSAINMQESKGNGAAVGPQTDYGTAKGGFQFLDGTAKRFGLIGSSVFDIGKSAEAAAKYFEILYKKFGDWDRAISAYHAGEGNVERNTGIGPVNRAYVKNVKGYIAGSSDQEFSKDFTADDYIKDVIELAKKAEELRKKTLEDQKTINEKYFSDAETRKYQHEQSLADIEKSFSGNNSEIQRLTALENEKYKNSEDLLKLQQENEIDGWSWVGEEKLRKERDLNQALLQASTSFNAEKKALAKKAIDDEFEYQLAELRKTEAEKSRIISESIGKSIQASLDAQVRAQAKKSMNSYDYAVFENQEDLTYSLGANNEDLQKRQQEIADAKLTSESEIADLLLAAQLEHQLAEEAILAESLERQADMRRANLDYQLDGISSMLGAATELSKGYLGDQSAGYLALFNIQKGFNTAIAAMNVWTAASEAYAKSTSPTVWGRAADAAIAAAQAQGFQTLIQGISPVGMAHSGMTSIPREGTWLLDGGERVVSPEQNKDLTGMIQNYQSGTSSAPASEQTTKIVNVLDSDELVGRYMRGSAGEKIVLNFIRENGSQIKRYIG